MTSFANSKILIACAITLLPASAFASDACSTRMISTTADVVTSYGATYQTRSTYRATNAAVIEIIRDAASATAVEGPYAWTKNREGEKLSSATMKSFALGHQFHAFLLYFNDIARNIHPFTGVDFQGRTLDGITGDFPYGGKALLFGKSSQPTGLRFEFPDTPPIDISFLDWRKQAGATLPHHIHINDGASEFDYRYSKIDITERSPLWFFDAIPAPAIDEVQIYRLHRKLLAAHCLGDADLMAKLTAPQIVIASRGDLFQSSDEETRTRFTSVFKSVDYTGYYDLAEPIIEVAESGDLGWAGVNVRAVGADKANGEAFDDQWAWVMLARKIDGVWRNAGNASNLKQK
ncbi:MAG: nuclear transport factor 2 family protein [Alphaproteobacteria bacterium]|nr:nuclear transport factor 2 family protein [Alphaproteobacteria bacterium]